MLKLILADVTPLEGKSGWFYESVIEFTMLISEIKINDTFYYHLVDARQV